MKKNVTEVSEALEVLEASVPFHVETIASIWPQWVDGLREDLNKLLAIGKKYLRDVDVAFADEDRSDSGRAKQKTKIDLDTLAKFGEFDKQKLGVIRTRIGHAEREMFEHMEPSRPTNPGDRLAYELRLGELRAELRALQPEERLLLFASSTDSLVIDALESAPPTVVRYQKGGLAQVVPFLDPEARTQVVLERARNQNPDQAAELQAFHELAAIYETAIGSVRRAIEAQIPTAHVAKELKIPA